MSTDFPNDLYEEYLKGEPNVLLALLEYVYDEILGIQDNAAGNWGVATRKTPEQRLKTIEHLATCCQKALNQLRDELQGLAGSLDSPLGSASAAAREQTPESPPS